jgi:hypothetical protein
VTGPAVSPGVANFTGSDGPLAATAAAGLDALGVRWFFAPRGAAPPPGAARLAHASDLAVWERPSVGPRAWIAGSAAPAPSPEAALWEASGAPADRSRVHVEGPPDWIGFTSRGRPAAARVVRDDGVTVEVAVPPAPAPRVLVLADAWAPGWRASAGGTRLRVLPADCAFRAVAVPPGAARVRFDYAPLPLALGIWLGGIGLGLLGGCVR